MICKIADFYIEIHHRYPRVENECRDYICEAPPRIDFSVAVTEEELLHERAESEKNGAGQGFGMGYLEFLAVYRKICGELLRRDAFMMHGAVIEYEGRGYLFTAKSGTGKTTHIRLWQKVFGEDKVTIINGDKPILRFIDGRVYAYGTPWNGKERYGTTGRTELHCVCFVHRAVQNGIARISADDAVPPLFSQIMITDSADLAAQLELVDRLVNTVSLYELHCNLQEDAAIVAYRGMQETETA